LSFENYTELLRWRAQNEGSLLSYCFLKDGKTESQCLTYQQLDEEVRSLAAYLQEIGSEKERALLILENDLNYIKAFFACLYSKTIAVTLHPPASKEQLFRLQQVIKDCNPKFILSTSSIVQKLQSSLMEIDQTIQWIEIDQIPLELADSWVMPGISSNDLAFLQYTSGSTSFPKGVMVSHRNLLYQGEYMQRAMSITRHDISVMWLPHFHDMGLILGVLQGTYTGYPTYIMTPLSFLKSPLVWLKAISKYRATLTAAPNFAYDLCCEVWNQDKMSDLDLSTLKCALNGAEPVRKKTLDNFTNLFEPYGFKAEVFYPAYGMAETTLMISGGNRHENLKILCVDLKKIENNEVSLANHGEKMVHIVGCGTPHLETVIKIVDPKTSKICSNFTVGEIHVKNENITTGYWENKIATKENFDIFLEGEGPFFKTGDLGFLDDSQELYISGRHKDVIIINGRNHAPQDIELTVQESHPAILNNFVGAFSITQGEKESLVVIAAVKTDYINILDGPEISRAICKKIVSIHEVQVEDILLIRRGAVPKTTSGKIQRNLCRLKYLNNEFITLYQHSSNNTLKKGL